ncbi:unnamed protein product [Mytilus coruscus]|uniref:Uncharacterized protein n=1 Tax=Mytilus coruscus TaxID=42192 RepID=A0A6J8DFR3_MYTCO|nr:unnamed protein product [Mytilus coruscus]
MDNISQVTENILSQTEMTLEDLSKCRNEIKKRVSEIKQKFIAHLDKLKADIHKGIDNKYKQCNETVSRNKDKIKSSTDSLSIWKKDLKSLKQHTSEIHLFQAVKYLDAKTHQKELEMREIQTATVPILTYHPSESASNIKKFIPDLGAITVDTVPVPMSVLYIDLQGQFLVRDEKILALTSSFQTKQLGDGVSIFPGCFIPGHRLLVCQNGGRQLYVCQLDGSKPKVINLDDLPFNITLYGNNHAKVSVSDEVIQIIDLTTLKPGGIINVEECCRGITSVKDKIWVNNQRFTLTIVDINGK